MSLIGPLPTPGIAYLTQKFDCRFGVVISASHNPYEDNGIKFFDATGSKLSDETEARIEALLDGPALTRESVKLGRASRVDKSRVVYQEFCASTIPKGTDIKICGIKTVEDALAAIELGADLIGFNFYPKSPRCVEVGQCRGIMSTVGRYGHVRFVGVFVNASVAETIATMEMCGLSLAQLHGDETPEMMSELDGKHSRHFVGFRRISMASKDKKLQRSWSMLL